MKIVPGIWRVGRPDQNYVVISNEFARSTLSPRAKSVGLYLLTHDEGYVVTQRRIARELGMSESAVAGALGDLEAADYLRRQVVYAQGGGVAGTAYLISDSPLESMTLDSMTMESMTMESRVHKKTTSNQKTKKNKKTNPPGGAPRAEADVEPEPEDATTHEEEPMPRRDTSPQMGLFEAERPAAAPKPLGAHAVAAAYVDAFRTHYSSEPTKGAVGRVGRLAKELLGKGTEVALLIAAATALGATPYAALDVQLNKMRRPQPPGSRAMVAATPHGADEWEALAASGRERTAELERMEQDPAYRAELASMGLL